MARAGKMHPKRPEWLDTCCFCHTISSMSNVLPRQTQVAALVEGCSVRSTERLTGVHRDTIIRLMVRVGNGCANLLDETMVNLPCARLELDELWAFVGKKQRHVTTSDGFDKGRHLDLRRHRRGVEVGAVFSRRQAHPRVYAGFRRGRRASSAQPRAGHDGRPAHVHRAIASPFARTGVDYAQLHKTYETEPIGPGRYSPPKVTGTEKAPIFGAPLAELVSTSYVERQNLTVRMGVRRYTRLTNAFSKKLENHTAATALHFAHYNFVRQHKTLRTSPAMAAGVSSTLWNMGELVDAALAHEGQP